VLQAIIGDFQRARRISFLLNPCDVEKTRY